MGEENAEAVEMLLRLPGITWRNYRRVMARVDSIAELVDCSLERLTEILENGYAGAAGLIPGSIICSCFTFNFFYFSECAQRLYNFFHSEWTPPPEQPMEEASLTGVGIGPGSKRPRFDLAARVKTRTKK